MTYDRITMDSASVEIAACSLGTKMREAARAAGNAELLAREAERLRRTMAQTRPLAKSPSNLRRLLAAAVVFGTIALGGFAALEQESTPIAVEARTSARLGGTIEPFVRVGEHHLAAPLERPIELRFSDGSEVVVVPFARLRVQALHSNGASLLLEKGSAKVRVLHHHDDTRWTVAVGPFSVAVVGTRFDVSWDPATEKIRVELFEGRVEIAGPKYASPATLLSGQRFEASADASGWSVTPLGTIAEASRERVKAPISNVEPSRDVSQSPIAQERDSNSNVLSGPRSLRRSAVNERERQPRPLLAPSKDSTTLVEGRQWSKLVASGEFKQVTREADTMGLMACLSNCSAADLRALADASRYTGRLDTAEAALRALHEKYPAQATSAVYLLGSVDEARGRNVSALRWYEAYLEKISSGGFVAEARAARLRMLVATGGNVAARQAARDYLESYPRGAAAGLATKILEGR